MNLAAVDIDPIEDLLAFLPEGRFAEDGVVAVDEFGGEGGDGGKVAGIEFHGLVDLGSEFQWPLPCEWPRPSG